jgi:hypothetical protein
VRLEPRPRHGRGAVKVKAGSQARVNYHQNSIGAYLGARALAAHLGTVPVLYRVLQVARSLRKHILILVLNDMRLT